MATDHIPAIITRKIWGAAGAASVLILVLAACRAGGFSLGTASAQESRSKDQATAVTTSGAARREAVALARLLPASGLISVGVRPGARVVELEVKEDDQVSAGTVLAILEGHDSARLQLDLATAQKKRAEHERGARLAAARKAAELTDQRLGKGRDLFGQFGAALKGKERYDAELALHQLEMQAIRNHLDLDLARGAATTGGGDKPVDPKHPAGPSPEEAILQAQVDLAAAAVRATEVRAPGPGRILRVLAHPGELSSGALLQMGDVSSMVARAEVYQSDVTRIRPGDPAEVDILGTRVAGKVGRIGSIVGKNQFTSIDPRALRDLRVVEVTIQLDQADPANRFVEMEVDAVIRPSGPAPASEVRGARESDKPAG
jgi:multidrug efflux pump subunit AcrA (membrane-fusion protein)